MPQSATTLNCHFVVVYPKALHSSGPLSRRHAQSHSARVLAHVTYYPRPAEAAAAAAVLIRLATAICDHQAYVRGSIRTRARARANQASNLVHVTTLERSRSRLRNNPRQDIASSSTSTSHSGSHNHMRKNEPQPLHESFPSPRLVCTFLPTVSRSNEVPSVADSHCPPPCTPQRPAVSVAFTLSRRSHASCTHGCAMAWLTTYGRALSPRRLCISRV
jgi:hypothetical protein